MAHVYSLRHLDVEGISYERFSRIDEAGLAELQ